MGGGRAGEGGQRWKMERRGPREIKEGEGRARTPPDSCLHPDDMKSWIKHCFISFPSDIKSSHFLSCY